MTDEIYEYYIFSNNPDERLACVTSLGSSISNGKLVEGVSLYSTWPSDAEVQIHDDYGDIISDFVENTNRCLIVSEKVRNGVFESGIGEDSVEFLPFILKNKKGRKVKEQYYIVNPLLKIDCIDEKLSTVDRFPSGKIMGIDKLYISIDRIPNNAILFRLGELPRHIIIRSDLADTLRRNTSGFFVSEMGDDIY